MATIVHGRANCETAGSSSAVIRLTRQGFARYRKSMAQSYLVFDFGGDEDLAQQARHKVEGWKQGFRLGNKILLKFDRVEATAAEAETESKPESKKKSNAKEKENGAPDHVRVLVRLDFSGHEKLSFQRWLDRIPTEEPFKSVKHEIFRQGGAGFEKTAEHFESLS
jgi:hypothetical protein